MPQPWHRSESAEIDGSTRRLVRTETAHFSEESGRSADPNVKAPGNSDALVESPELVWLATTGDKLGGFQSVQTYARQAKRPANEPRGVAFLAARWLHSRVSLFI